MNIKSTLLSLEFVFDQNSKDMICDLTLIPRYGLQIKRYTQNLSDV